MKKENHQQGKKDKVEVQKNKIFFINKMKDDDDNYEQEFLNQQIERALNKYKPKIDVKSTEIRRILEIVQTFITKKELLCYGGTAINNILPPNKWFYNYEEEIPDFDVFSKEALKDAKELANVYHKEGFLNVEAKAGIHEGTYKVFVDFIPIIDITQMTEFFFTNLKKESKNFIQNTKRNYIKDQYSKNKMLYCPPDFLRAQFYKELSEPSGNAQRWLKIYPRLKIFNEIYPLEEIDCFYQQYVKRMKNEILIHDTIFDVIKKTNIEFILSGSLAINVITKRKVKRADFQLLSVNTKELCDEIVNGLNEINKFVVKSIKIDGIDDFISDVYEIEVNDNIVCRLITLTKCSSYNTIKYKGYNLNVASIDTLLYLFLMFSYIKGNGDKYLCMSHYLFEYQKKQIFKNKRSIKKGVISKFNINCKGPIETKEKVRKKRSVLYKKYSKDKSYRGRKEYEKYFLKYDPSDSKKSKSRKSPKNK